MIMKETEKILKVLANYRRLAITKYLNKSGSASVGDIAEEIKLSFKATSKHLGIMRSAGLLERDQVDLQMIYSLNKPLHSIVKTVISNL
jgi:DNA-binding transcriptional ArsR family regulator